MAEILGVDGVAKHIVGGGGLSYAGMREYSPDMIANAVDREVVMQFNAGVPVSTFMKYLPNEKVSGMSIDHFAVDLRPIKAVSTDKIDEGGETCQINVGELHGNFSINDQIKIDKVDGYSGDKQLTGLPYNMIVVGKTTDPTPKLICQPINGKPHTSKANVTTCLEIPATTDIYRITNTIDEPQNFNDDTALYPQKTEQYAQIFMATFAETELSSTEAKDVDWGEVEMKRMAIYQMQIEEEAAILFGTKSFTKQTLPKPRGIYTFDGFLAQAIKGGSPIIDLKEADLLKAGGEALLIDMMKTIFTGNSGSTKKYLLAGSDFISTLSKIKVSENNLAIRNDGEEEQFGVTFSKVKSNFGTLHIYQHPLFDSFGHSWSGFVLDLAYVSKRTREAMRADKIDDPNYRGNKVRILETFAPVFKYPKTHAIVRISNS